jgi:hypothetical protein
LPGSDLAKEQLGCAEGVVRFQITILVGLDESELGVAVVINDRYPSHRYLRLPLAGDQGCNAEAGFHSAISTRSASP